jgi:(p)ppGpp synthase/HD superfamily hydrolase
VAAELFCSRLERGFRWAAECHDGQRRRSSGTPYFEHLAAVALVLDRAGYPEDVVIAGVLHDLVEDTPATLEDVASRFGAAVAEIVRYCSEEKTAADGKKRPWIDRKRDHIAAIANAPAAARAVFLADKLHNLISIELDLLLGRPVWPEFHAPRAQVLWYYEAAIDACGHDEPRLERLAGCARATLARVALLGQATMDPHHPQASVTSPPAP